MSDNQTLEEKYNNLKLENQELKRELESVNQLFDEYVITSITDTKGIILSVSKAFEDISGYSNAELIGRPHNIVRHEDMPSAAFEDMWNTIQSKKIWRGEVKNRKKDGNYYWVDTTVIPLIDARQQIMGYRAIRINITDKKLISEKFANHLYEDEDCEYEIIYPE
jgi:PAS domain S-box-containing protein